MTDGKGGTGGGGVTGEKGGTGGGGIINIFKFIVNFGTFGGFFIVCQCLKAISMRVRVVFLATSTTFIRSSF